VYQMTSPHALMADKPSPTLTITNESTGRISHVVLVHTSRTRTPYCIVILRSRSSTSLQRPHRSRCIQRHDRSRWNCRLAMALHPRSSFERFLRHHSILDLTQLPTLQERIRHVVHERRHAPHCCRTHPSRPRRRSYRFHRLARSPSRSHRCEDIHLRTSFPFTLPLPN
jgi:hypothetical protein